MLLSHCGHMYLNLDLLTHFGLEFFFHPGIYPFFPLFRLYKNLPEVKAKNEQQKRLAFYRTNRLRAQLYDKVSLFVC